MATGSFRLMALFAIIAINLALDPVTGTQDQSYSNVQISGSARKLLNNSTNNKSTESMAREETIVPQCDSSQISVRPGPIAILPLTYSVEVVNVCGHDDCKIGNIHLNCLFFLPSTPVEPPVLEQLTPGDCLLNDGRPLDRNEMVTFRYTSPFPYLFTLMQATCL